MPPTRPRAALVAIALTAVAACGPSTTAAADAPAPATTGDVAPAAQAVAPGEDPEADPGIDPGTASGVEPGTEPDHSDAVPDGYVTVRFVFSPGHTPWREPIYVVGELPELGGGTPRSGIPLRTGNDIYPLWHGSVALPADAEFRYRYVAVHDSGPVTWCHEEYRERTPDAGELVVADIC